MAEDIKKYLSLDGLNHYDDKIKEFIVEADDVVKGLTEANKNAIDAINHAETGILAKANAHTDAEVDKVQQSVSGLAEKVGTVPEGSTVMGIIQNIQENAYDDTEIRSDVDAANAKVDVLIGVDSEKSVRTIANEELAAQLLSGKADADFKTLQELASWLEDHPESVGAINDEILALKDKTLLGNDSSGSEYETVKAYVEAETKKVSDALQAYEDAHAEDYDNSTIDNKIKVATDAIAKLDETYATDVELGEAIDAEAARVDGLLANKVDKVTGKGLSDNDLTNDLKANYDDAYEHSQAAHAPADAQKNVIESIKVNGVAQTIDATKAVDISVPTDNADLTNGAGYLVASDIANKADKATTLAGYGITDAYTKDEVNAELAKFVAITTGEIDGMFA